MPRHELREMAQRVIAHRFGLDLGDSRAADVDRALEQAFPGQATEVVLARITALPLDAPELGDLIRGLTIGETYFFRDRATFNALQHGILTRLIAERRASGLHRIRIWSAGCSTGEEPYSLAILLHRMLPDLPDWQVTIQATDLNEHSLDVARRGRYRQWSLRETPDAERDMYFRREGRDELELDPRIRAMVNFAQLNLAAGAGDEKIYPQGMDLVLCRNVLMYLTRDAQQAVVSRLAEALAPGGWLAVGGAEASIELFRGLRATDFNGAILYANTPLVGTQNERPPLRFAAPDLVAYQGTPRDARLEDPHPSDTPVANTRADLLPVAVALGETVEPGGVTPAPNPIGNAESGEEYLTQARAAADEGDLLRAREHCEKALATDPLNIGAHLLLADVCRECGDREGARVALQRAIFLAPDSATAHFTLGTLLLKDGIHGDARRAFATAIRILEQADESSLVPGSDGMTAGAIVRMAEAILASMGEPSAVGDPSARLAG